MSTTPRLQLDRILHGGDYNPDQWLHDQHVLAEDLRLMELARCNVASLGIFAWSALEPREGEFTFDWMDERMDAFAARGWKVALATPSAAVPHWMTRQHPDMMRTRADGRRCLPGDRMHYCLSHAGLLQRVRAINGQLAARYAAHPALLLWHISNEYVHYDESPGCHCEGCQAAFRDWLKERYNGDLDRLNRAWWCSFWSHTYTDWQEIIPPAPHGDTSTQGLALDWRRFVTDQTIRFYRNEIAPLRELAPAVPITTNLMGLYKGLDYWKFAEELDVVSWDSYPTWHIPSAKDPGDPDRILAADVAFTHDLNRGLGGGKPFLLMESTPSVTNWQPVAKLKRPGMHLLSSVQAVAHGADAVMYFQWRKSRGAHEKFHGAVVDHVGHENTRVFRDVASVGRALEALQPVVGATVKADVAIVYDWQNCWAIEAAAGPRIENKDYTPTCQAHYRPLWNLGIPVDFVSSEGDLAKYRLVIAPMLYMLRPGVAERLEEFVGSGGTLVTTYWSGIVDETDLVFQGGIPGPLRRLLGIWSEEIDALHPGETRRVIVDAPHLGWTGDHQARELCDLVHAEGADVLARYAEDFYAGRPALTVNRFGKGEAYYVASRNDDAFTQQLLAGLCRKLAIKPAAPCPLPKGVSATTRQRDGKEFLFLMNFTARPQSVTLDAGDHPELLSGERVRGSVQLGPYGVAVLERQPS